MHHKSPRTMVLVTLGAALSLFCCSDERGPTTPLDRSLIPAPVFDERNDLVDFYWTAWEQAWRHVTFAGGVPRSPFMDEGAIKGKIWIWDTCFMALFTKYAPGLFPGVQSLENFYAVLHDGSPSSQEIEHLDNPPLFAWAEWESYKTTGDKDRLRWLLETKGYLQRHFAWFERKRRASPEGYTWSGNPSGMDNTPRGRSAGGYEEIYWMDAMAQQALSAHLIAHMALDRLAAEGEAALPALGELYTTDVRFQDPIQTLTGREAFLVWTMR